jgi:hypothetical protein
MRNLTVCMKLWLLLPVAPAIAVAEVPRELRDAMDARVNAVWDKNVAVWSRFTADEFAVVVPEGRLLTKAERIAGLERETPQAPHAIVHETVHVYGDAAIRRFVDEDEWVLEVWVRQHGTWRVVAAQVNFAK